MKRLIRKYARAKQARVENEKEYLNTIWYNPNEGEKFTVDDVFDGMYELKYHTKPEMVDYQEVCDFDMYLEDNGCEKAASKSRKRGGRLEKTNKKKNNSRRR